MSWLSWLVLAFVFFQMCFVFTVFTGWVKTLDKPTRWIIKLQVEARDMWFGVYWTFDVKTFDMYVCLIPMFPIHSRWTTE